MRRALALVVCALMAACEVPPHDPAPWVEGAVIPPPLGCREWRDRDPEADC